MVIYNYPRWNIISKHSIVRIIKNMNYETITLKIPAGKKDEFIEFFGTWINREAERASEREIEQQKETLRQEKKRAILVENNLEEVDNRVRIRIKNIEK